jgi:probable phosphoglycerate mutase
VTLPEPEYRQARYTAPAGSTRLLLVRHGESAPARPSTPFPLTDGRGDPELAPEGVAQAHRVADRLCGEPITALYVTTLCRTAQTAAPLAERLGRHPSVLADLAEVGLGEWEGGLLRRKVAEGDPLALRLRAEQRWDVIPGAEPADEFATRVRRGVWSIAGAHPNELVAVFTHGGVIGQILAEATGSTPFAFTGSDNGSISELVVTAEGWVLRRYNDTGHLG